MRSALFYFVPGWKCYVYSLFQDTILFYYYSVLYDIIRYVRITSNRLIEWESNFKVSNIGERNIQSDLRITEVKGINKNTSKGIQRRRY